MTADTTFDSALKKMRVLYVALLVEIPVFVYAGEVMGPRTPKNITRPGILLAALAIYNTWFVLVASRRALRKASVALSSHPDDTSAIRRWRITTSLSLTASLPLALYGWVLRVMGGTFLQALPLYACGLLLLLVSTPRRVQV